jgi:restriction system protein
MRSIEAAYMGTWTIKGGRHGQYEAPFLERGLVAVGFGLHCSAADFPERESLRDHLESRNAADQIWRFCNEVAEGDMVVLPRKMTREVAVGRIVGPYAYQPELVDNDMPHVRAVNWQVKNIPRSHFDRDLLNSFGSLLTISQPAAPNAEARIAQVVSSYLGLDQAAELSATPITDAEPSNDDGLQDAELFEELDIDQEIRDRIVGRLRQKFAGTRLEYLVASILKTSGYFVLQTREGADGGVDVLAGKGDMGFEEPRLCVQVKGRTSPVDLAEYDRLQGNIASFRAEHGLLVSLGGFTKPVHDRNEQSFFVIRLWGPDELAQRLMENYDSLPQDIRADIPLETVRILRPAE